jgi:biotin--protein ligase
VKSHIYIYSGPGAAAESLFQTLSALQALAPLPYKIHKIGFRELKGGAWAQDAALLIMPGGADIPYAKYLSGEGTTKIRGYVEQGGSYLGICAGAYFASTEIIFEAGTPLEVHGTRELKFFPGIAEGPVLAPYDYQSNAGARIAKLQLKGSKEFVFSHFNGGCHFVGAKNIPGIIVHATYGDTEKAAIIEIKIGKGIAILSGVHPEFSPHLMNRQDPYLRPIAETLEKNQSSREYLMEKILEKLGIKIKK